MKTREKARGGGFELGGVKLSDGGASYFEGDRATFGELGGKRDEIARVAGDEGAGIGEYDRVGSDGFRGWAEIEEFSTGEDSGEEKGGGWGDEDEGNVVVRLFEKFKKGMLGVSGEQFGVIEDDSLVSGAFGAGDGFDVADGFDVVGAFVGERDGEGKVLKRVQDDGLRVISNEDQKMSLGGDAGEFVKVV